MADLNVMLLEHARSGLQAQLDTAVTNGDTEAARKVSDELGKLSAASVPKAAPYGNPEIVAEMEKLDWYGVDPKKSARAMELGKTLSPKKFGTAAEFAAALVKAVDEEFKPAANDAAGDDDADDSDDAAGDDDADGTPANKTPPKKRASDAPNDADASGNRTRRTSGPWAKMSDAPADVQKEINRTADKFAPKTKEGREKFVAKALEAQYSAAQLRKGKK